ncbi:MAG: class I SAM-dependent DNA methyltransferase [Lachnospiraceae bacterium]
MPVSYESFAAVYDRFMDNIPYGDWSHYLITLLKDYQIEKGHLVELGCGTGTLCKLLSQKGYQVTGIDLSKDMISIAKKKIGKTKNITFLQQNMCQLMLDENLTYDCFYSLCDSMNYLLYEDELLETFQGVHNYLKSDGIFIFDLKTKHFYQNILGNQVFCDHREECSYIWENSFFEEDNVNQYDLTLFIKKKHSSLFQKFEETHHQKAYELSKMIDLLTQAGLEYVTAYDAFTKNPPTNQSERIYVIAKK